jgi:branched-subunit amino acid ABC-type transport system permease component
MRRAVRRYSLAPIPASFLVAAVGRRVLERGVIRFLYGRPLETLLATWGISLVLMQRVRSLFGAQNVPVENPSWLSGGSRSLSNLALPYNRSRSSRSRRSCSAGIALLIAARGSACSSAASRRTGAWPPAWASTRRASTRSPSRSARASPARRAAR